jgi:hypothetical protein
MFSRIEIGAVAIPLSPFAHEAGLSSQVKPGYKIGIAVRIVTLRNRRRTTGAPGPAFFSHEYDIQRPTRLPS